MKVEKMGMFLAVATIVAIMPSLVLAQTTSTPTVTTVGGQTVMGNAVVNFGATFGTPQLGASASGFGGGSFQATDPGKATGGAQAVGSGSGMFTLAPGKASSSAASSVVSGANVTGAGPNTVAVYGGATQANWANVPQSTPTPTNYAGGGNTTTGGFNGSQTAAGPLHVMGGGGATGNTAGFIGQTPTSATAGVETLGQSKGVMYGVTGTTEANGYGTIGAGAQKVLGGSYYAGGSLNGTAAYNAPGGTPSSTGWLNIRGQTTGSILPNSVTASSGVVATAAAGSSAPPINGSASHP